MKKKMVGHLALAERTGLKSAGAESNPDFLWFKGLASTPTVDRDSELILASAFTETIPTFLKGNPAVTLGHEFDTARAPNIGRVTHMEQQEGGLYVEGYLGTNKFAQDVRKNLQEGIPMDFSIAYMRDEWRDPEAKELETYGAKLRTVTTKVEMLPLGIVNCGSNRHTHVALRTMKPEEINGLIAQMREMLAKMAAGMDELEGMMQQDGNAGPAAEPPPAPEGGTGNDLTEDEVRILVRGVYGAANPEAK